MDVKALYKISYGLYVVNTVFQVTSDPVQIAACLRVFSRSFRRTARGDR